MSAAPSEPTEITSLLAGRERARSTASAPATTDVLPPIGPTVTRLQAALAELAEGAQIDPSDLSTHTFTDLSIETAFVLNVLLRLRSLGGRPPSASRQPASNDVWEAWSQATMAKLHTHELDTIMSQVWSTLLKDYRTADDIERVLWTAFPDEPDSRPSLRVVDALCERDSPEVLFKHGAVHLSLLRTWKVGTSNKLTRDTPLGRRILMKYDSLATPRVLHGLELICHIAYLIIILHFIFDWRIDGHMPEWRFYGAREYILFIYSLSILLRPWSPAGFPALLVFLSFLFGFSISPYDAFDANILAFGLYLLQFNDTHRPSPLFLFSFQSTLPLAVYLSRSITRVLIPVILFCFPFIILAFMALSNSMRTPYLLFPSQVATMATGDPIPMLIGMGFMVIFFVEGLLFVWMILIVTTAYASSMQMRELRSDAWDRFSPSVGADARRHFIRAVVAYSGNCYFPPPFNLLPLVLVSFPKAVSRLWRGSSLYDHATAFERALWRVTVGPVVMVLGGLWLWGIRA